MNLDRMTASPANYWCAFALDAGISTTLVVVGVATSRGSVFAALGVLFAGIAISSFYRYAFHRWWFHGAKPSHAVALHAEHHARPSALIATPFFLSLLTCAATFALGRTVFAPPLAAVFAGGMLLAHFFEGALHHTLHNRRFTGNSWLARRQRRHDAHHRRHDGNFDTSTAIWDRVLGTELPDYKPRA